MPAQAATRSSNRSQPERYAARPDHTRTRYPGQPILAIRAHTSERLAAQFVHDAFGELHSFIRDHDLKPAGPPFAIVNHTSKLGTLDIEAGWPINHPTAGADRIHGGTLPTPLAGHSNQPSRANRSDQYQTDVFL